MGTIEGAAVGAAVVGGTSALAAALTGMGIPRDSVIRYEQDIKAGKFLLIANGNSGQVEQARSIVGERGGRANIHAR